MFNLVARERVAVTSELDDEAGLFGPDSVFWRVWREQAQLLGGGRAILLQLAHPMVAAGVAQHSDFQSDPLGRLNRTLDTMLTIVFGRRAEAEARLRHFHALHAPVQGHLMHAAGRYPAHAAYYAHDPALKLWVHATLMDTGLLIQERFVQPLTSAERAAFYADSQMLARRMGIPDALIPPTLADFRAYMASMLSGDTLTVTDTSRALARVIFDPPILLPLRLGVRFAGVITAGLLPDHLRVAYGMPWNGRRQALLNGVEPLVRRTLPLLPGPVRLMPQARAAQRRACVSSAKHG